MKTTLLAMLIFSTVGAVKADHEYGLETYNGAIQYNIPVIYHAPVLYQAAVIYNAPVFYVSNYAPPAPCTTSVVYTPPSPNVIVTGGSRSGAYYTSWNTTPNVIIVGHSSHARVTRARCR